MAQVHGVVWFKTGFLPPAGQDYDFGMDPVSGRSERARVRRRRRRCERPRSALRFSPRFPQVSLSWIMLVLMAFAETRRLQDYRDPGSLATGHVRVVPVLL